jgi:hypothetical protein
MDYGIPPRARELVLNIEEFPEFWSLSGLYYTDNEEEEPVESFPPRYFTTRCALSHWSKATIGNAGPRWQNWLTRSASRCSVLV